MSAESQESYRLDRAELLGRQGEEPRRAEQARIGLLVMGRKRPGFDPEWGAQVLAGVERHLQEDYPSVLVPSRNISCEGELRSAVAECREAGVQVLVIVQPTISDGRLALLLSRLWPEPLIIWATPEKPPLAVGQAQEHLETEAAAGQALHQPKTSTKKQPDDRMISANSLVGSHVMAANLRHCGHSLEFVYGSPRSAECRAELRSAIRALHASAALRGKVVGLVGYHAPGFVDFHADPVFIRSQLGAVLYHLSTVELLQTMRALSAGAVRAEIETFNALCAERGIGWHADALGAGLESSAGADWQASAIEFQARYYAAFRQIMSDYGMSALAFRCWPDLPSETGHWPYFALARLVSEGYAVAMEGDVDGALCSLLAEAAGLGPVYLSDWLAHNANSIVIWHTGAAPFQLSENAQLSVQFNNKLPTVVDSTIRTMEKATLFRLWRFENRYLITALEGETCAPLQERMATNGRFQTNACNVRQWFKAMVQQGMPHHICLVEGHNAELLRSIAHLLNFTWVSRD